MDDIKKFEPLWGNWYVKELIGEGGYGKVYRIERNEYGVKYEAALKYIRIPQSKSEIKSIMMDGMDEKSVTAYFENFMGEIIKEFALMSKLKGNSHIVSYEDHKIVKAENELRWDIFIRMELLTSLVDYVAENHITKRNIIRLGIDICKALETCQKYNIIHRDIKPENIFISDTGQFKLGDFGIARQIEKTVSGLSKKGTFTYIAPEVYKGEAYGSSVDIYSLGLVMYRFLNNNRMPFMPAYPAVVTHMDREMAFAMRVGGKEIPKPVNADGRLAEIVLKACAFNPKERYTSPYEMRRELESIQYSLEEAKFIYPEGDTVSADSIEYVSVSDDENKENKKDIYADETMTMVLPPEEKDNADETMTMVLPPEEKDNADETMTMVMPPEEKDNADETMTMVLSPEEKDNADEKETMAISKGKSEVPKMAESQKRDENNSTLENRKKDVNLSPVFKDDERDDAEPVFKDREEYSSYEDMSEYRRKRKINKKMIIGILGGCAALLLVFAGLFSSMLMAVGLFSDSGEEDSEYSSEYSGEETVSEADNEMNMSGDDGNIHFEFNDRTLTISGNGDMEDYNIFMTYEYYPPWNEYGEEITNIIIEDGVTHIGNSAFWNCENLVDLTIADSVKTIGYDAFIFCDSLKSVKIPDGVTTIGDFAFAGCDNLIDVTLPDSVVNIGNGAFGCSEDYSIENGIFTISGNEPMYNYRISSRRDDKRTSLYKDEAPWDERKEEITSVEINPGITRIGNTAFADCLNLLTVTIPGTVKTIGIEAFYGCSSLTSVTILEGVTTIEEEAFYGCSSLTSITIPEGVTTIERAAFANCTNLSNVVIPSSVTSIEDNAFSGCNITSVTIPNSATILGAYAFDEKTSVIR